MYSRTTWANGPGGGTPVDADHLNNLEVAVAKSIPRWVTATAYVIGEQVVSPGNDAVSANVAHTSSAAYATDVAKWVPSSTFACLTDTTNGRGPVLTGMQGTRNEALGSGALVANGSVGQKNVAVGWGALAADTGSFNSAVGESALAANTTGTQNVAVGQGALHANLVGGFNVAVGVNALGVATGSQNTVVGQAGAVNTTTGASNTAAGWNVQSQQTTGSFNAAFGASSLPGGTGSNNSAFGYNALGGLDSGLRNTAVGNNSSPFLCGLAASDNVAVGANALGPSGTNATFWSQRQTAIGDSSGMSVPDYRYDTCTITSGSSTVLDASIGAGDAGKPACASAGSTGPQVGLGIGSYIGSGANAPVAGVSFTIVDVTNTPVLATVNRTQVMVGTTQVNGITAIGYNALAGGAYASAIEYLASAGASGAVAIGTDNAGTGASTTTANEFVLGTALHTVRVKGTLRVDTATATTVGAAGAAAAIPTPVGYLPVSIGGTTYKIPFVNV